MTSRRTGESPRDRAAPARLLTLRETGRPEGPHTRSLVIQRGRAGADTDTADNRHAHQPQGRPRTQTLPRSEPIAPPQHGSSSRRALTFASERERQRPAPWPEGVSPTQAISHKLPVNSRDAWWAGGPSRRGAAGQRVRRRRPTPSKRRKGEGIKGSISSLMIPHLGAISCMHSLPPADLEEFSRGVTPQ